MSDNSILHRHTLRQAELSAASCIISEAVLFHRRNEQDLINHRCNGFDSAWMFGSIRADATNASFGDKYQCFECDSTYIYLNGDIMETQHHNIWPEIVQVLYGTEAEGWRLYHRQMNSVEFPTFDLDDPAVEVVSGCAQL